MAEIWLSFALFCYTPAKTNRQRMIKCAQNHFGEVSMLVQYIYKVVKRIMLKKFEWIWVKIRLEKPNQLRPKCINLCVNKEEIALGSSRNQAMGNPSLESHSSMRILATNKIFTTKLQRGENQMMSKEIINFKLEKIWTSLATRKRTHKIYGIQIP